jgi:hypothetical protein
VESICFFYKSALWQESSEKTINSLVNFASRLTETMYILIIELSVKLFREVNLERTLAINELQRELEESMISLLADNEETFYKIKVSKLNA